MLQQIDEKFGIQCVIQMTVVKGEHFQFGQRACEHLMALMAFNETNFYK
jgi:hypothetical protein